MRDSSTRWRAGMPSYARNLIPLRIFWTDRGNYFSVLILVYPLTILSSQRPHRRADHTFLTPVLARSPPTQDIPMERSRGK